MNQEGNELTFKGLFLPLTTKKAVVFIFLIGIIIFFNGLSNGFVGDDHQQLVENVAVRSLQNIPSFFSGSTFYNGQGAGLGGAYYKPILTVAYSFIYAIFGSGPFGFHFFQVIIHITNACLLFLIFKLIFRKALSFVLAIVFLVHPINSEAAFYIAATQEVLFFFFGAIAFWILQNYKLKINIILLCILLLISLLSKETGILFSILLILYAGLFKKDNFLLILGASVISGIIYFLLRINAIGFISSTAANSPIQRIDLAGRLVNMPSIFIFYLKTFFWPVVIATDYQWIITRLNISNLIFPLTITIIILVITFGFGLFLYKKYFHKYFFTYVFFACWFLLGIIFHLQIFPLDGTVSDRWFYFPMVGMLGMLGVVFEVFRISRKKTLVILLTTIVVVLLSVRTIVRSFNWRDDLSLANHDLKFSKDAWGIESTLSFYYLEKGLYKDAKEHAQRSIDLFPFLINYTNLGTADLNLGNYQEAKNAYLKALTYGDIYATYENLAVLATFYGDPKENIAYVKYVSLKKFPHDAKLWLCLAILDYREGNKDEAKSEIEKAYFYNQGAEVVSLYMTIMNDQPLKLRLGK
jgi:protein O-mannosyl-transferase